MKRVVSIAVALLVIGVVARLVGVQAGRNREAARHTRYDSVVASFRKDLAPGTKRAEVAKYLGAHHVEFDPINYTGKAWSFETKIEDYETFDFPCSSWTAYVTFDFEPSHPRDPDKFDWPPANDDDLVAIHQRSVGRHCL